MPEKLSISSGVPQWRVLGPVFCMLYTADVPTTRDSITGILPDGNIILVSHEDPVRTTNILQNHLDQLQVWLKNGRSKSTRTNET